MDGLTGTMFPGHVQTGAVNQESDGQSVVYFLVNKLN